MMKVKKSILALLLALAMTLSLASRRCREMPLQTTR